MSFCQEYSRNCVLELLNQSTVERCRDLHVLLNSCSVRELQDLFPTIVNSIFDLNACGLGWGLRVTTKENSPQTFDALYDFFIPQGPMLGLCYRLLNDSIKFEFNVDLLPRKLIETLQTGQYSMFYSDLLSVDPFNRCVSGLLLNAFDFYILNFALHGTLLLHKHFAAAMQVHNEKIKTVYFYLSAQYLCTFLPGSPDQIVIPTNTSVTVKTPHTTPAQPLSPIRSTKYFKTNASNYSTANIQTSRNIESPGTFAWRTESVLNFFMDSWLRYDIDEARDIPSSEFMRVVRILVKQTHNFSNCAAMDTTPMASLRKMSQLMIQTRMYPFLRSVISRWPLDSSLSVVLELWLSYIQPWRYALDWQADRENNYVIPISNRFDNFIQSNLTIYTQIFVLILPRFECLDFTTLRNVIMLHRLVKVFSQTSLPQKLYDYEQALCGSSSFTMSLGSQQAVHRYSTHFEIVGGEWDTFFHESTYTPMFGPAVKNRIKRLMKSIQSANVHVHREIQQIRDDRTQKKNNMSFFRRTFKYIFEDISPSEVKLQEITKIPDFLDLSMRSLNKIFDVTISEILTESYDFENTINHQVSVSLYDKSDYLDLLYRVYEQKRNSIINIRNTIDPALLPIQQQECSMLVRFLHQVSCKLNEMCSRELQTIWERSDIWGKFFRRILNPPITTQWFENTGGINQLCKEYLPPRISLRSLASYKTLILIFASLVTGQILWSVPSYGFLILMLLIFLYFVILTIF